MSADTEKHETGAANEGFEREDLSAAGVIYFLLALVAMTVVSAFLLRGLYEFLDKREKAEQPAVSPLVTNAPVDTRNIPRSYPQGAFPNPKLEEDERDQLNGIRLTEEQTLNSYGWVDEKAGTIHIPIDRAMDLIAQRGLPVRSSASAADATLSAPVRNKENDKKENDRKKRQK